MGAGTHPMGLMSLPCGQFAPAGIMSYSPEQAARTIRGPPWMSSVCSIH